MDEWSYIEEYLIYHSYIEQFGHTFTDDWLSEKSWQAAQVLMRLALKEDGEPVTDSKIRQYLRQTPNNGPVYL